MGSITKVLLKKNTERIYLLITERIIFFDTWIEPMSDDDTNEWIPDKGGFEARMKYINELYITKGIDAVLEELPYGGL